MNDMDIRIERSVKKRKILNLLIAGFILMGILFYFIKLPVSMAGWFVPFKVETPTYIPLNFEKSYVRLVGFDRVQIVHETQSESITTWATSEIGWNKVSNWDEKITLDNGTAAYYNESVNGQMISWRIDDVEYAIDYAGSKTLSKEEMIKMASSIK